MKTPMEGGYVTKYRAIKTEQDGQVFDSKREAGRYRDLVMLERCGIIRELRRQPAFDLAINGMKIGKYVADFEYLDQSGRRVVEDVKGVRTPLYKLKAKLVLALHGIRILET